MPDWPNNAGVMQAWVAAGKSREERRRRLAECPEWMRDRIKGHVETLMQLRKRAREKSAGAGGPG